MKGDFTRMTFDPTKHYSRVLEQQGRVQVDADWNEMNDIHRYFLRRLAADLIGPHGGPGDSFKIGVVGVGTSVEAKDLRIGVGRYYVDGMLCENEGDRPYIEQSGFPFPGDEKLEKDGAYFLYLDVWERHVTDLEDEDSDKVGIRDTALRGPDTATRAQIVWQVRCRKAATANEDNDFDTFIDRLNKRWDGLGMGAVRARAIRPKADDEPCLISPEARYRGAENQLYRVEIHQRGIAQPINQPNPDPTKVATFKWSRENGSVIFPITDVQGEVVILRNLDRETRFGLRPDDWVEIVDDDYALHNRAEPLLQVKAVDRDSLRVTLKKAPLPPVGTDPQKHPLLRRWDHHSGGVHDGAIPIVGSTGDDDSDWVITLEDGVQIQFSPAQDRTYETGEYWLIPARVATGDVDWPGQPGSPLWRPPNGIEHKYAPLAKLSVSGGKISVNSVTALRRTIIQLWK